MWRLLHVEYLANLPQPAAGDWDTAVNEKVIISWTSRKFQFTIQGLTPITKELFGRYGVPFDF
jgi:hypothetical protein